MVQRFGLALLGTHEEGGADHHAGLREVSAGARGLGQPEVGDLDRTVRGPHEVGWLDVAVAQAGGVGGPDPLAGVDQRLRCLQHGQGLSLGQPVAQAAAGLMVSNGGGVIINVSSQMGHVGSERDRTVYVMTKHAVEGLTKAMALELAPNGVRVV